MTDELFDRSGVRYEVACDLIGALIAHLAEAISVEERQVIPDLSVIADGVSQQQALRNRRERLDPGDRRGIEETIDLLGPLARAFYTS